MLGQPPRVVLGPRKFQFLVLERHAVQVQGKGRVLRRVEERVEERFKERVKERSDELELSNDDSCISKLLTSSVAHSMKANFPHTLHLMTGSVTPLKFRFTWTRVWLRKVLRSSSDIASVVLPTNSSRWTLSLGSVMTLGAPEVEDIEEGALGSGIPVSSCQVTCFVWIPVYLEGRVIFRYAPMKGMLFKLRRFAAWEGGGGGGGRAEEERRNELEKSKGRE